MNHTPHKTLSLTMCLCLIAASMLLLGCSTTTRLAGPGSSRAQTAVIQGPYGSSTYRNMLLSIDGTRGDYGASAWCQRVVGWCRWVIEVPAGEHLLQIQEIRGSVTIYTPGRGITGFTTLTAEPTGSRQAAVTVKVEGGRTYKLVGWPPTLEDQTRR